MKKITAVFDIFSSFKIINVWIIRFYLYHLSLWKSGSFSQELDALKVVSCLMNLPSSKYFYTFWIHTILTYMVEKLR